MSGRLGVCSWSLRPGSAADLARTVRGLGLRHVQLALDPIRTGAWPEAETVQHLRAGGITVVSGMMGMRGEDYATLESIRETGGLRPDEHWEANLAAARENAALAERLGLRLVTFHAGFIPDERTDPLRVTLVQRLRAVADEFAARRIRVGLETGQEDATTLLGVLRELDRPTVGVNFDPANMILYGKGDPIDALRRLAPRVLQVHVKDALPAESWRGSRPAWGTEVPVGRGAVDWPAFFRVLSHSGARVDYLIERESGVEEPQRLGDIAAARELVQSLTGAR